MKEHLVTFAALMLLLFGCAGINVPAPECPPCKECPPPCPEPPVEPPVEPPPTIGANPEDYVHIDRVNGIVNGTSSQDPGLMHGLVWGGWRDPLYVAVHCAIDVDYIGFTSVQELADFGETGRALSEEGTVLIEKLWTKNRRCNPAHPLHDPRFLKSDGSCERSEVRKEVLTEYRSRHDPHLERAADTQRRAQVCRPFLEANGGVPYDSIAGWCQSMERAGVHADSCP